MEKEKFNAKLLEMARKMDIEITEENLNKFYNYKEMIIDWNKKINLTAITDDSEFLVKHFIDSITVTKYIENKPISIIDIGTGAGFPGIPIRIINENNKVVLFDSLNKRLKVLDNIIETLDLKEIETLHGRAEETFKNKEHRETFDIAVSRAVANLNVLVELMLPAIKVQGTCICMKGNNVEQELKEAQKAIKILGGEVIKVEKIILPETDIERNIIIIKKVKTTPNLYPRKPGTPKREPIK